MTAADQSDAAPDALHDAPQAAQDPGFEWRCPGSDCTGAGCGRCTAGQDDDRRDGA